MFETLKLYTHKEIPLDEVLRQIAHLGYQRVDEVHEEGDFSVHGDTLEIFPVNFSSPLRIEWEFEVVNKIYSFDKALRKKVIDYDFLIIIPHTKRAKRYSSEDLPLDAILRVKKGDYVVHSRHGIGKFLGVKKLKLRKEEEYFFEIEYANKDKLYVAKEEAHFIQKYVSFTGRAPKLNRLGSKEWLRLKARVERGIKTFALEILRLEAQRKLIGGFKYSPDGDWQKLFEERFPFELTEDQFKAILETKKSMESKSCMDRIVCGDVGYGKTEVAMRAAFKAVMDGKQGAFLVPTTILAYQHYLNFAKRVKEFPFQVEMLSRFCSPAQQRDILERLKDGKVDIVIGTHRLLSGDVEFKNLGFLVIDEEHKFGVEHKEKIKKLRMGIDVLTLSATPIPRTLYMGLIGIKDISLIKTPPKERLAVKTIVDEFSPEMIKQAVLREIKRKGEVFIIHNRIESIFKLEKTLRKILPESAKIGVIHGRLHSKDIEKIMLDFIEKRINCLLSTAIVESGIDIPSANTIIINDAHMFGLADLHQLRGRVGRFNVQAYAYLFVPRFSRVSEEAKRRLDLIQEFSHLGAGFEVAMSDLELRGAGNILGREQHGFVYMVGFDMYCRLLKKEIEYLRQAFKIDIGG